MNNKIMISLPSRITPELTAFLATIHLNQTEVFFNGNTDSIRYIYNLLKEKHIGIYSLHMQKDLFYMPKSYIDKYLRDARKIGETFGCSLLFHPNGITEDYIYKLQSFPGKVAFENTTGSYIQLKPLLEKSLNFYLVYDIAHARYFHDSMNCIDESKMLYIHIQGYNGENTVLLNESDEEHYKMLYEIASRYNCPFMLENSYKSYGEIILDLKKLRFTMNRCVAK